MLKFKFFGKTKKVANTTLQQTEAVRDFGNVKAGDIGGWLGKESNLSDYGDAYVFGDARMTGDAYVFGDTRVS